VAPGLLFGASRAPIAGTRRKQSGGATLIRKPTLIFASAALLATAIATAATSPLPPIAPSPKPCANSPSSSKCPGPWLPPVGIPPKR
jgi:hypothetical protein